MYLIDLWAHVTPLALCLAAAVLLLRLVIAGKWRVRMARASAFLLLSYAVLMLRVLSGRYNPSDGDGTPLPIFAAFYLAAALYFLYALVRDWLVPFVMWGYLKLRGIQYETAGEVVERITKDA